MREAFDSEARTSGKPRLILSAATAAAKQMIDSAYDIPVMVKYVSISKCMLVANFSYTYNNSRVCLVGLFAYNYIIFIQSKIAIYTTAHNRI